MKRSHEEMPSQGGWPKITDPRYRKVTESDGKCLWHSGYTGQKLPEALSGVTFGRLLQVIVIAITGSPKLLGFREGALVPYGF